MLHRQFNRKYDAFWLVMKGNVSVKFSYNFLHVSKPDAR